VEFNKPGGMIMPILVEITYEDDYSALNIQQIWRKVMIALRSICYWKSNQENSNWPKLETADIDVTNNTWPKERSEK
jgi:hypothetical protein